MKIRFFLPAWRQHLPVISRDSVFVPNAIKRSGRCFSEIRHRELRRRAREHLSRHENSTVSTTTAARGGRCRQRGLHIVETLRDSRFLRKGGFEVSCSPLHFWWTLSFPQNLQLTNGLADMLNLTSLIASGAANCTDDGGDTLDGSNHLFYGLSSMMHQIGTLSCLFD